MVIHKGNRDETHFLNVDLDIYSRFDLQPLVDALGEDVSVLYVGRERRTYAAHLEVTKSTKNADQTIAVFCALIEALPKPARRLWNSAKVRDFNVGVQAESKPHSFELAIGNETLKAAAKVGARIVFTVYGRLATASEA